MNDANELLGGPEVIKAYVKNWPRTKEDMLAILRVAEECEAEVLASEVDWSVIDRLEHYMNRLDRLEDALPGGRWFSTGHGDVQIDHEDYRHHDKPRWHEVLSAHSRPHWSEVISWVLAVQPIELLELLRDAYVALGTLETKAKANGDVDDSVLRNSGPERNGGEE